MLSQLKLTQTLLIASLVVVLSWYLARDADCVKDSVSIDGMNNSAGSYCLLGSRTKNEASVITRLRAAGAVILGTINMSEWGNARSSGQTASNGWSAVGGQTYGVYYHEQDPCGSSSGSGVAMALGLAAAAVGVETVGSITCPAMRSNLVSIKTTSGLVPRDNVIVTKLRGSVGPMTRTVQDAAIMLNYMAGPSSKDPVSLPTPFSTVPDYTKSLKLNGLANSRLAVPRNNAENPFAASMDLAPIMQIFDRALAVMRELGATIIDHANYSSYTEINAADAPQGRVGPSEYRFDMENHFKSLVVNPHNIKTMEDLIRCTKSLPEEEYPSRDIAYWEHVIESADFQSPEIAKEIERMRHLGGPGGVDGVLDAAGADAIVFPSVCSSDVPGLVGYPVICVPLGFMPEGTEVKRNPRGSVVEQVPGIPFGLSFIGKAFSEQKLIELAYSFEQHTQFGLKQKPVMLPTADICSTLRGKKSILSRALATIWRRS
ncbi:amidase signature domain-containing protein [Triangularia verruculosa]|uniref:Amidase signature domain-containing protein n=1 Tax=Triangularia verruculosa TaxID=2587418 RepID=A0AAN6XSE6_9PEZI|nr:amidase signature domain-containing protein [Triangularia verruculosa]